jgi:hypothetical protein
MERIKEILDKYTPKNEKAFKDTVSMLCKNGIGNGVYQDYSVLVDVIEILSVCETIIAEKGR